MHLSVLILTLFILTSVKLNLTDSCSCEQKMGVLITRKIQLSLQKCHFCFYMVIFLLEHLKPGIIVEENTHLIHFCRNLASLKLLTMIISLSVSNSAKRIYCAGEGGLKPSLLVGNSVMGGTWVGPGTTFPCKRLILTF